MNNNNNELEVKKSNDEKQIDGVILKHEREVTVMDINNIKELEIKKEYNEKGILAKIIYHENVYEFEYNYKDSTMRQTLSDGIIYVFDSEGNIIEMELPDGDVYRSNQKENIVINTLDRKNLYKGIYDKNGEKIVNMPPDGDIYKALFKHLSDDANQRISTNVVNKDINEKSIIKTHKTVFNMFKENIKTMKQYLNLDGNIAICNSLNVKFISHIFQDNSEIRVSDVSVENDDFIIKLTDDSVIRISTDSIIYDTDNCFHISIISGLKSIDPKLFNMQIKKTGFYLLNIWNY